MQLYVNLSLSQTQAITPVGFQAGGGGGGGWGTMFIFKKKQKKTHNFFPSFPIAF